ncbi:hypothetical protein HDV00_011906 [Rhizophlyctis rosea]|nr:hypothetical protein HDV00_011906 [Rhizophlyctis rosea]
MTSKLYSSLQVAAGLDSVPKRTLINDFGKSDRLVFLDAVAFLLTPQAQNPTAVSFDITTKTILIGRNKKVPESSAYTSNFFLLLKVYLRMGGREHAQSRREISTQLLKNAVAFCFPRLSPRLSKLKLELLRQSSEDNEPGFAALLIHTDHALNQQLPTDAFYAAAESAIQTAYTLQKQWSTTSFDACTPSPYPILLVRRIFKVSEYANHIRSLTKCVTSLRNRPSTDIERQLVDEGTLFEIPSVTIDIRGLDRDEGVNGLGLKGHEEVIYDRVLPEGQKVSSFVKFAANREVVFFRNTLTVDLHAEMAVAEGLIRRGVVNGRRTPIGISNLCCFCCGAVLRDQFEVSGFNEKIWSRWKCPDFGVVGDAGEKLLAALRERSAKDMEKLKEARACAGSNSSVEGKGIGEEDADEGDVFEIELA